MTMATRTAGSRRIANISATVASAWPNRYDAVVFLAVGALFVGMAHAREIDASAARGPGNPAGIARPQELAAIRASDHAQDVRRAGLLAPVHVPGRAARRQEQKGRARHHPGARYSAIRAGAGLSHLHRDLLHEPVSGQRAWRGTGRDLRDLHEPGLEHDVLVLSVADHRSARPRRSDQAFQAFGLACASGSSKRPSRCRASSGT